MTRSTADDSNTKSNGEPWHRITVTATITLTLTVTVKLTGTVAVAVTVTIKVTITVMVTVTWQNTPTCCAYMRRDGPPSWPDSHTVWFRSCTTTQTQEAVDIDQRATWSSPLLAAYTLTIRLQTA